MNSIMQKEKVFAIIISLSLTACASTSQGSTSASETSGTTSPETVSAEEIATTAAAIEQIYVPSEEDTIIAKFLKKNLTNSEEFSDKKNYQYYARAIGQDKDYFLDPSMWEVFYNEEDINRNKDINGLDIYLIRLDPYKLLDVYAENNGCTVDELCKRLSVSKEQMYYNWGYNPASVSYLDKHKSNEVTYSTEEQMIFGIYNNEERNVVMDTHMIVHDHNEKEIVYISEVYDTLKIKRRDNLKAFSGATLYSEFTDEERNPAFKIKGIGIRAAIPLTLPNAFTNAGEADKNITVMINRSPFTYGCADEDKLDLEAIYKYIEENQ